MYVWEAPAGTNGKIQRIAYLMSVETSSYILYVMLKDGSTKKVSMCKDSEFLNPNDKIALYEAREQREEIPIQVKQPKQEKQEGCILM